MDDLDAALARLADAPLPPRLATLHADVFARIAAQPPVRAGLGWGAGAVIVALIMGIAGAVIPMGGASASLAPLGADPWLAPSTLLAGAP